MSSGSGSSHRQARRGSASRSNYQPYQRDVNHIQFHSSVITRREGSCHSSREFPAGPDVPPSISDHQTQESESFASNGVSFGGSTQNASYTSEKNSVESSTEFDAQSHEIMSQYSYFHSDHFSYIGVTLSHYDDQLTIEEDPDEQSFVRQPASQYTSTVSTMENGMQASNNELYALQTYSPTTEMWSQQESRDERIRLGLPGGQQTPSTSFYCDQEDLIEAQNYD